MNQNVLIAVGDQDNAQYAGQNDDAESSSQHAMFRQYSSTVGRWMSPDPSDASYSLGNPQSFNRYSYALNTPFSATDPSGLDPQNDVKTVVYATDSATMWSGITDGIDVWAPSSYDSSSFFDSAAFLIPYIPLQRIAPGNRENPPPCQAKILNATNNQFGTNYTEANVISTFNYSTGAGPGQGTLSLKITGSTAGVTPGYYPIH